MEMVTDKKTQEAARAKLTKVYQFLQALDQMRNPVKTTVDQQLWSMWLRDFPTHECIEVRPIVADYQEDADSDAREENELGDAGLSDESAQPGTSAPSPYLFKVRRPTLTDAPTPPPELTGWLKDGWQRVEGTAEYLPTIEESNEDNLPTVIRFEDYPARPSAFALWSQAREAWLTTERPARQAMAIFERLYSLHNQMERESEQVDLILGDGILAWSRKNEESIHHPLLLQRVQLDFDPSVPQFTVRESDQAPELYTALLRILPDLHANAVSELLADLAENAYPPLGSAATADYLKRIVTQISPHGQFYNQASHSGDKQNPIIVRDPLMFLRRRTLGFGVALERILDDLKQTDTLPTSVLNIVGIETQAKDDLNASQTENSSLLVIDVNGEDERVLLSKEANAEQLQIALRLQTNGAVLVQGPPGTGKTHTIANLLGHLLAQGKSVLVTSHTAKALRVLREKVVKPLQPLCVSVLENDTESRRQMEDAVDAIAERLSALNADTLDAESALLTKHRTELLKDLRDLRNQLQRARQDEYRPIVVAGDSFDPSQAARKVHAEQNSHGWIPSPVALGEPLSLSLGELIDLYASNEQLKPEAERELQMQLPDPGQFLTPADFASLVSTRANLQSADLTFRQDLWTDVVDAAHPASASRPLLATLSAQLISVSEPLKDESPWRITVIAAGKEGGGLQAAWEEFSAEIESVYQQSIQAQPYFLKHGLEVAADLSLEKSLRTVDEILQHLKSGGKLNFLSLLAKGDWKQFIQKTQVDGRSPEQSEHFEALQAWIQLRVTRDKLKARWSRQMTELGGPAVESLGEKPEEIAHQFIQPIQQNLSWYRQQWLPLRQALESQGLRFEALLNEAKEVLGVSNVELVRLRSVIAETLPVILQAQANRLWWADIEAKLQQLAQSVTQALVLAADSVVIQNLQHAITHVDENLYQQAYVQLTALHADALLSRRRQQYLQKLEAVAPTWAAAIRHRSGVHGMGTLPGDVNQAWLWRQLHDELEQRNRTSMEELQAKIADRSHKLRELTAQLVEKKAWSAQVRRTTLGQRQALQGWKLLIRKAGKGTGIRAPRLLAEARKLMPICQSAVPVWIMPMSRVVENFVPGQNRFDVVIIDEASQADVMALTGLYFGNEVLVVGDDEQVSPDAVGQRLEEVQRMIDTYLADIPNGSLYDGKSSIYDLAKTSFPEVQLREHFRCVAPIIQFSNHLSYGGDIRPLRDASEVVRRPATVAYRVEGAMANAKVNEKEAQAVTSLLLAATEHPAYRDATFGVISLLGDDQAMLIESLLRRFLSATEYQKRLIRCGNSAQFQGDERDVMFLSVVHAPAGDGPLRMLADPDNRTRKRFNVAASRARDQMWVVHSLDPQTDLKEGDLRKRLILHAEDPYQFDRQLEELQQRTESEFEKQVLQRLVTAGYRVTPQWWVGGFRIDMVVEGGGKRLAVECDGDRWHPPEKLAEDMARQAILERLGWRFVRIRGSQFFRNPEEAMESVYARLRSLDIPTEGSRDDTQALALADGQASTTGHNDEAAAEIQAWIVRRAAELRREWADADAGVTAR